MAKQIIYHDEAREALKRGIDKVANAVKITIGPRGRNVVIDKGWGSPTITNDGVSIAKEITLSDKIENMGAEIVKEVANKTNELAGDGTTTAAVLAQAMITEGFKRTAMGVNAMGVKAGIEAATTAVVEALKTIAKPIKDKDETINVASIAAENAEFGRIIADAIDKVGKDGVVTVEESQGFGVESEVVEGMQFDKGYVSPYFVTNAERMEANYNDPYILITDKKISSVKEILPLLEILAQMGKKELVILAEDVDGEAMATLIVNKLRGTFNTLAIKAPGFGDKRKEILEDIAILTGGKVVSEEVGIKLESATVEMLGRARRVVSTKDDTTIVDGKGKADTIKARVALIKKTIEMSDSKYDKEKLHERLGKLSGGVAVIRVGAATETEMKYKKLKVEDAVQATKAAMEEGIVPGGGAALIHAGTIVAKKTLKAPSKDIEKEFQVGVEVVLSTLSAPLKQIAMNGGKDDGAVIVEKVRELGKNQTDKTAGYDAGADEVVKDLLSRGIIDPVKVTRAGLQHAASAASVLLTTEVAIAEEPKKEEPVAGGHGGGMGGGMDMGY